MKKGVGYRNTFDLGMKDDQGRKIRPEDGVDIGRRLIEKYGEFERFVTGDGISGRDPVEVQSDNPWIMVDATNSDETHWEGGRYTLAGRRTYCVSLKHLKEWRCQDGVMGEDGQLRGFGGNPDHGYDIPK